MKAALYGYARVPGFTGLKAVQAVAYNPESRQITYAIGDGYAETALLFKSLDIIKRHQTTLWGKRTGYTRAAYSHRQLSELPTQRRGLSSGT